SSTTSCGAMAPPAAWPMVRISIIVSTMVRMTTSVAPKVLARSRRNVESNNIVGLSNGSRRIMDFRHQIATPETLSGVATDALVVVISGDAVADLIDPAVSGLVKEAISHGDFQLKAGRTLYLHRPQGLKAARLVVAAAGGTTVKAFRAAVANALGLLKG